MITRCIQVYTCFCIYIYVYMYIYITLHSVLVLTTHKTSKYGRDVYRAPTSFQVLGPGALFNPKYPEILDLAFLVVSSCRYFKDSVGADQRYLVS